MPTISHKKAAFRANYVLIRTGGVLSCPKWDIKLHEVMHGGQG